MPRVQENVLNLNRSLPRADAAAGSTSGSVVIPVDELLTPGFIFRHTGFADFSALLRASDFDADQVAGLEASSDGAWESFIRTVSCFSNWGAMLKGARGEWIMHRLGLCGYADSPAAQHRPSI